MKKINILGINITKENNYDILNQIHSFLNEKDFHYIVTPNPEIILKAKKDEELFYILNKADISLPDAMGLKIAALIMGQNLKRFTGSDLTSYLLSYAEKNNYKIAILNWRGGLSLSKDISVSLKVKFPKLNFYIQDIDREAHLINFIKINKFSPDILFSTLGSPYQEKSIYNLGDKIANLKIALAVGGSFDFISEKKIRAPRLFRKIGLEWLWRLIIQPNRIKRIYNATFVFMFKFFLWNFLHPFLYRPSVACLLFKREGGSIKVLMVKRKGHENHWQLPQGGTEGQALEIAGERELKEEIGTDKFKKIATYKNIYKYRFITKAQSKFNAPANKIEGYKGQKQGLFIAEFLGNDKDININYWEHIDWKWVELNNVLNVGHETRKKSLKLFIDLLTKTI